jgi:hypothetical protein
VHAALISLIALVLVPSGYERQVASSAMPDIFKTDVGCGEPANGLQICLSKVQSKVKLEFRNLRSSAMKLNMGIKLGNGDEHPSVRLLTRVGDQQQILGDGFAVHGNVYPWVTEIPAAASRSITIDLRHYRSSVQSSYWLIAEYTQADKHAEQGYWSGSAKSAAWWVD